jgi:hypothetical protein
MFSKSIIAALLLVSAAGAALAQERQAHQVGIVNRSGDVVREIYVAPQTSEGWGGNRLISRLPGGANASIRFTGPCAAKIRVVGERGGARDHVADLCAQSGFALLDDRLADAAQTEEVADAPGVAPIRHAAAVVAPTPVMPAPAGPVAGAIDPGRWTGHYLTHHYGGL